MVLGVACALLSPVRLKAQKIDPRAAGTTYVFAFPDTTQNTYDSRQDTDTRFTPREPRQDSMFVYIYSAAENTVEITDNNGYRKNLTMTANSDQVVFLNGNPRASTPIVTESFAKSNKTFRIEAVQPVVVYCFMVTKFGTEAFTPIPVESWGTEYYASALPGEVLYDEVPGGENNYGKTPKAGPSEILVMAAFDGTVVTITPNGRLDRNAPAAIALKKGECYQIQSYVDTSAFNLGTPQPDLGGSYISSNKPIGVISGNTRSQVIDAGGLAKNSFKNMMIEWLTPVDQHGTQFVYLPTWDDRRPTGAPNEKPEDMRSGEVVRVYGTSGDATETTPTVTEGVDIEGTTGSINQTYKIPRTKFFETLIGAPVAHVFKTDKPAQAFMNTTAVVKFNGTTGGGNFVGSTYESWATYMVEMTPREQWTYTAPYYAPIHPPKMNHFMNIVTDEKSKSKIKVGGAAMVFNRQIPGTDLWWGTKTLNRGDKGLIEGADSTCKFYAFVYGSMKGFETYRPGRAKKDGDGSGSAGARDRRSGGSDQVLHPSEYEENIGFLYGYPVAPSRLVLRPSDSLLIDSTYDCETMTVRVRTLNSKPVGLRAISLDSAKNAKLVFVDPAPPEPVIGLTKAEVKVVPIDKRKDASGIVIIQDRTGKIWKVYYKYIAEYLNVIPSDILEFGQVTINDKQTKVVTIVNPLPKPVSVDTLLLALKTEGFTIVGTKPAISNDPKNRTVLKPGDTLLVTIQIDPTIQNKEYGDTLKVKFGCTEITLPLHAQTVQPCIYVDDLDFGILAPGQEKSLPLNICNKGKGQVTFKDPWLTWLVKEFDVKQADIDKLKTAVLKENDCVQITVTFKAGRKGTYLDVARFWASTRDCRDTSVWKAVVTQPGPQITGHDWGNVWVVKGQSDCTKNQDTAYVWDIVLSNDDERPFTVAKIFLAGADASYFRLDSTNPATTIRGGDVVRKGEINHVQRVLFKPKDERGYNCLIRVVTEGPNVDSVDNILQGVGIESHVSIGGNDYGIFEFKPALTSSAVIDLKAPKSTRDMTVSNVRLLFGTDFAIRSVTLPDATVLTAAPYRFTLKSDEVAKVAVDFTPQAVAPANKADSLIVDGDFSICDDSTNTLLGQVYTVGAVPVGVTIPTILSCGMDSAFVAVYNTGSSPIQLNSAYPVLNPDGQLTVAPLENAPITIAPKGTPGDTVFVKVYFNPAREGGFAGSVGFQATRVDEFGATVPVVIDNAPVNASAVNAVLEAHIDRGYSAYPGSTLNIPIVFDGGDATNNANLEMAKLTKLHISFSYNTGVMLLQNGGIGDQASLLQGTALQGFSIVGTPTVTTTGNVVTWDADFVANPGEYFKGPFPKNLLNLKFKTYIGDTTNTDINFSVTPTGYTKCVTVNPKYGFAKIDSVCGLNFRLIEAVAGAKYELSPNKPNPVTGASTDIQFSLGLDGQTELVIYNALGQKVATLVDQYLQPGTYTVTWDVTQASSGLYYYRLNSGAWTQTNTMMLNK